MCRPVIKINLPDFVRPAYKEVPGLNQICIQRTGLEICAIDIQLAIFQIDALLRPVVRQAVENLLLGQGVGNRLLERRILFIRIRLRRICQSVRTGVIPGMPLVVA